MTTIKTLSRLTHLVSKRSLSGFSFVGPKSLDDVLKLEKVADKSTTDLADLWYAFHDDKHGVLGLVSHGQDGKMVIERARKCPFFIQPVFRDDGFFMLVSQYMDPSHFCMAYLEDYKMDPHSATPLLTFSVFNDFADIKNISFVRGDILNRGIADNEGQQIVLSMLKSYIQDHETIKKFNQTPQQFDIDDYISKMSARWKQTVDGFKGNYINGE
ncbi:hypothetical protein MPSEU_000898900 [Mayamaea pseudoterrestris]|nr:hypothetical protein MPSEU_000898900 [Mayamaea pseudoterrestris]